MRFAVAVLLVSLGLVVSACGPMAMGGAKETTSVSVMTQDLGVGADLEGVLAAAPADRPARVDAMWAAQERSSFAARVGAIADEIARLGPDLVGVQSALLWRREVPASAAAATDVASDYLALLLAALAARGSSYDTVAIGETSDLELTGASGNDYRVTDREVILARAGLATSGALSGTFLARRTVALGAAPHERLRGWAAVQAQRGGKSFRFVSTHLEATDVAVQGAQAVELLSVVGGGGATLVVGGIPSDPRDPAWPAYGTLVSRQAGLADLASQAGAGLPTCCRDATLVDPAARLDRRLDLVLGTGEFLPNAGGRILGDSRMVNGVWPSSHAGVLMLLELQ